jgi:hypothetical protein
MWSNHYDYYRISASANQRLTADTKQIQVVLDAMPDLERIGLMSYRNAMGFPWIDLVLAKAQDGSFSCSNDTWHDEFNLISIVCSKTETGSVSNTQIAFLVRLAQMLNWELINEENDAGQKNVIIWKPQ